MNKLVFVLSLLGCCPWLTGQECGHFVTSVDIPLGAAKIAISGNYEYVATGASQSLRILDISNPESPIELPNPPYFHNDLCFGSPISNDIVIEGNYAYLSYYCAYSLRVAYYGFFILNISDPFNVEQLGDYYTTLPDWKGGLAVKGNFVFMGAGPLGVQIIDVSNKYYPVLISSYDTPGLPVAVELKDNLAFIADGDYGSYEGVGLIILDISDPYFPSEVNIYEIPGQAQDLDVTENIIIIGSGLEGFHIIDIEDPENPMIIASVPEIAIGSVHAYSHYAFITGSDNLDNGKRIFALYDIAISNKPFQLFLYDSDEKAFHDSAYADGYTYLVKREGDMEIIDIQECLAMNVSVLPVTSNIHGAYETNWKSDVVLHNSSQADIDAYLTYLQSGRNNSDAMGLPITVAANSSLKVSDIVGSFFGKPDTFGAVRIESRGKLIVSSRTYNDLGSTGTYGQQVPGYRIEDALTTGREGRLVQLAQNSAYRTNIGFANAGSASIVVEVALYKGTGELLGSLSRTLPSYGHLQENSIFSSITSEALDNAFAVVTSPTTDAAYFAYASVVDNRTGDAIFISAATSE